MCLCVVAGAAVGASTGAGLAADDLMTWRYAEGAASEWLQVEQALPPEAFTTTVRLPHRVMRPDRSLWYDTAATVARGGALLIDADDGAQLFVAERRVLGRGRVFPLPDDVSGRVRVTVRVLNNAMAGGLRRVEVLSAADTRAALVSPPLPAMPVSYLAPGMPGFARRMPPADRACRFTAWADSQGGLATFGALVRRMVGEPGDLSIAAGDLVDEGASPAAWSRFRDVLAPLVATTPLALVAGNHDYDGYYDTLRADGYLRVVRPHAPEPWFAWSCGAARFLAIDANTEFPIGIDAASAQGRWIVRESAAPAWRDAAWRVLVVHQPPWSRSWAGYDGDERVRRWVRFLAGRGLDLVIAGHSHAYERLERTVGTRAVQVLITGGAGGALEDAAANRLDGDGGDRVVVRHHYVRAAAAPDALSWEAVDLDGRVFDRVALPRRRGPGLRD